VSFTQSSTSSSFSVAIYRKEANGPFTLRVIGPEVISEEFPAPEHYPIWNFDTLKDLNVGTVAFKQADFVSKFATDISGREEIFVIRTSLTTIVETKKATDPESLAFYQRVFDVYQRSRRKPWLLYTPA